jgi:hypothetical protein
VAEPLIRFRPSSLANSLLFSTVRIVTKSGGGTASGTGFLYKHSLPNEPVKDRGIPFLVTNRHVVESAEEGRVVFLRASDKQRLTGISGQTYALTIGEFSEYWIYHADPTVDLAIMDLSIFFEMIHEAHGVQLFFRAASVDYIPTAQTAQGFDAIEDVFMIGYPNSLMDDANHLPIVRRGVTATPFISNYRGRAEFLIDASVFPGSSGSPVFLFDHQKPDSDTSKRLYLLGILSAGFFRLHQSEEMIRGNIPTASRRGGEYQEMLDLGIVIKSTRILELIVQWEQKIAAAPYVAGEDDEEKARVTDHDVNRLIYQLLKAIREASWQCLRKHLSTFDWHLLVKFKTSGVDASERLCLYRLLQLAVTTMAK